MAYAIHVISSEDEYLTSKFGNRIISGVTEFHAGLDFVSSKGFQNTQKGVNILAVADGEVVEKIKGSLVGNTVAVLHEGKILSRYQHMRDGVPVKVGDKVKKGQVIGVCGNTGRCLPAPTQANPYGGTHIHFAIKENSTYYDNGVYVDPEPYLTGQKDIRAAGNIGMAEAVKSDAIKAGDRVTVLLSAAVYATGQAIPAWVKSNSYTVQQVKDDRVLLKEITSWVYTKDVMGV